MSDGNDPKPSATRELKQLIAQSYVREMLELNPLFRSPQIMRRRREIWNAGEASGFSSLADPANHTEPANRAAYVVDPQAERELTARAKTCVVKLRTKFYELPDETLQKYLRVISSPQVPQYSAASLRLRAVAAQRETLLQATEETGDVKFAYSLQFAMIGTAAQSGALREQYIESMIAERRVVEGGRIVKNFVERHPEIYAIDHDWFDALLDPANQRDWSANYSTLSRARRMIARPRWSTIGSAIFISMIIINAIVQSGRSSSRRQRSPSNRAPAPVQQMPRSRPTPAQAPDLNNAGNPPEQFISEPALPDPFTPALPPNTPLRPSTFPDGPRLPSQSPNRFPGGSTFPLPVTAPGRQSREIPQLFRDLFPGVERLVPANP